MSELTDWIGKTCDECDRECRVAGSTEDLQKDPFKAHAHTIAARLQWHLRTHDAETCEQAMREQMEADCKAICEECDLGEPVVGAEGEYGHASTGDPCDAHAIRAAWAKAHLESGRRSEAAREG